MLRLKSRVSYSPASRYSFYFFRLNLSFYEIILSLVLRLLQRSALRIIRIDQLRNASSFFSLKNKCLRSDRILVLMFDRLFQESWLFSQIKRLSCYNSSTFFMQRFFLSSLYSSLRDLTLVWLNSSFCRSRTSFYLRYLSLVRSSTLVISCRLAWIALWVSYFCLALRQKVPSRGLRVRFIMQITKNQVERLKDIVRHKYLNLYKIIHAIDPQQAQRFKAKSALSTGASSCCGSHFGAIWFPKSQWSPLQIRLDQVLSKVLNGQFAQLLDFLGKRFQSVKSGGIKDGLQWTAQTQAFVFQQTMIEGSSFYILQKLRASINQKQVSLSKQHMLQAFPSTWYNKYPHIPLEFLTPEFLRDLHQVGIGLQTVLGNKGLSEKVLSQVKFIEKDGMFELSKSGIHKKQLKLSSSDLAKSTQFQHLKFLSIVLSSIPFQLTKKANLQVQISQGILLVLTQEKSTWFKDSDYRCDSGKKYSLIYSLQEIELALRGCQSREQTGQRELKMRSGQMLMIESRNFQVRFLKESLGVRYWIEGPVQKCK